MKKIIASFIFCFSLVQFFAFSAENSVKEASQEANETLVKYTNADKKYSIEYPSNWRKEDMPKLDLVLFAPLVDDQQEPQGSINVISEKVDDSVTLDQFYNESHSSLTTTLKEVEVKKSGSKQINGIDTKWVTYTHVMQGVKFEVIQYFVVAKDENQKRVYLMTFSAVGDSFDAYQPLFEKTASTFKVL